LRFERHELLRQLVDSGCYLKRHGSNHGIYAHPSSGKKAPVPTHVEIKNGLVREIRKQLGLD